MLPEEFINEMKNMLKAEYDDFIESYEHERYTALRLNPAKTDINSLRSETGWKLDQVPWEKNGFYYNPADAPGKHPFHEAGVYYIQEPSAMAPVHFLEACPGERILDLCAAPGGKSTQIAAAMNGRGILVCNEINPSRAKILSQNVERMGIRNALVLNETPDHLAEVFPGWFDRILVDAPCSGEGMFRKNEEAVNEWSRDNVDMCASRQADILDAAAVMLRAGGRLIYSTCTFESKEDEQTVALFLQKHSEYHAADEAVERCLADMVSLPDAAAAGGMEKGINGTVRLWPHKVKGEGHFLAVLERDGTGTQPCASGIFSIDANRLRPYKDFCRSYIREVPAGSPFMFGEQLYLAPEGMPPINGLKVMRPGLHLGIMKKDRFEPSHALALAFRPSEVKLSYDMPLHGERSYEARNYLNGQTVRTQGEDGWYLMSAAGYSIGWGKLAGGVMKNHYPRGLRINF